MASFSNKKTESQPLMQWKSSTTMSGAIALKKQLLWTMIIIGSLIACAYLSFPMPLNEFANSLSPSKRSLFAEEEVKEMYQKLQNIGDQTAMREFKACMFAIKKKGLPNDVIWRTAKNYLDPLTRVSLSKAVEQMKDVLFQNGTKWRFERIRKSPGEKDWQFGDNPMKKQNFEGKVFEVTQVYPDTALVYGEYRSQPQQQAQVIRLQSTSNADHLIYIGYDHHYGHLNIRAFVADESNMSALYINDYATTIVQILNTIPTAQISKSSLDFKYLNLELIKEIKGVSIRASNGKYLEWKAELNNHQITATAQSNESPNSRWIISFGRHQVFGNMVTRIMNEAKAFADDDPFIRFDDDDFSWSVFNAKGSGGPWCWMAMKQIKQVDDTGQVTFKALSMSGRTGYLSFDPVTSTLIRTDNPQSQYALFDMYVGGKKLRDSDFQRTMDLYESDTIVLNKAGAPIPSATNLPAASANEQSSGSKDKDPVPGEKNDSQIADIANYSIIPRWLMFGLIAVAILVVITCIFCILFAVIKGNQKVNKTAHVIDSFEDSNSTSEQKRIKITSGASFRVKPLDEWKSNNMTRKSDDDLFQLCEGDNVTETKTNF